MNTSARSLSRSLAGATLLLFASSAVHAVPAFDTFGALPSATFGGSGIPNDAVAVSSGMIGTQEVTTGLTAHQRFANPALTNNGAGKFHATPGANFGLGMPPSTVLGTTWNFGFHVEVESGSIRDLLGTSTVTLRYDADSSSATDFGAINLGAALLGAEAGGGTAGAFATAVLDGMVFGGSENLLFSFLYTDVPGVLTSPVASGIDPDELGVYSFELEKTFFSFNIL